jgi:hypothetical protein
MTSLIPTRHALTRMAQRGVTLKDADLIAMIGTEVEGGYLVCDKDYREIEGALKAFLRHAHRLVGKRLVVATGEIVTIYHATNMKQRRLLRCARKLGSLR